MLPQHEIWKTIPGFEAYAASNYGRIKRHLPGKGAVAGKILKPHVNTDGYAMLELRGKGIAVHRLVASAFLGPCPGGKEVNHRDSTKANNTPENLEYVTPLENQKHATVNGLKARGAKCSRNLYPELYRGERAGRAKLKVADVLAIRASTFTLRQIAAVYSISRHHAWMIRNHRSWGHI